jgi:hypothetical protein
MGGWLTVDRLSEEPACEGHRESAVRKARQRSRRSTGIQQVVHLGSHLDFSRYQVTTSLPRKCRITF